MKTLEKNINVGKDIVDTFNKANNEGYDLYACIGRNGRYGYNGKTHYELKPDNAVSFEGKLYAKTAQYEATDSDEFSEEIDETTQDGENATEAAQIDSDEESLTDDNTVEDGASVDEIEEDFSEEDEISLEEQNAGLLIEIEQLTIEVNEYKPLAEKYLAHKDLIDSIEQRISEANEPFIEEVNTLKNRLDRIKAVIEETE